MSIDRVYAVQRIRPCVYDRQFRRSFPIHGFCTFDSQATQRYSTNAVHGFGTFRHFSTQKRPK